MPTQSSSPDYPIDRHSMYPTAPETCLTKSSPPETHLAGLRCFSLDVSILPHSRRYPASVRRCVPPRVSSPAEPHTTHHTGCDSACATSSTIHLTPHADVPIGPAPARQNAIQRSISQSRRSTTAPSQILDPAVEPVSLPGLVWRLRIVRWPSHQKHIPDAVPRHPHREQPRPPPRRVLPNPPRWERMIRHPPRCSSRPSGASACSIRHLPVLFGTRAVLRG